LETVLSDEAVSGQQPTTRLAYVEKQRLHLERQIKTTKRVLTAGYAVALIGCTLAAAGFTSFTNEVIDRGLSGVYLGIEVQLLLLFPVALIVSCCVVGRHYSSKLRKLEEARVPVENEFHELWALERVRALKSSEKKT